LDHQNSYVEIQVVLQKFK